MWLVLLAIIISNLAENLIFPLSAAFNQWNFDNKVEESDFYWKVVVRIFNVFRELVPSSIAFFVTFVIRYLMLE